MASDPTVGGAAVTNPDGGGADRFADPDEHRGQRALLLVGQTLAKRPEKDDHLLAAAVESLCAWRRQVFATRDSGAWTTAQERELGTLNGVLSLVLAVQFPLGDMRWDGLQDAHTALDRLLQGNALG